MPSPPDPGEVDVTRFEQLVTKGQRLAAEGEMEPTSAALGEALRLRRGEPLAEFAHAGFFDAGRAHLDELTLVAIESGPEPTWDWGATVSSPASLRHCAGHTRSASACASCSSSPCTGADGRHTKNIYAKLAVTSRRAAVRRARELDLRCPEPSGQRPH